MDNLNILILYNMFNIFIYIQLIKLKYKRKLKSKKYNKLND